MTLPPAATDRTLHIYLTLAQYPILAMHIRARMRRELFYRGIVTQQAFEADVREKAIRSQALEGLHDPFSEEPADIWETRLMRVRDHLTVVLIAAGAAFLALTSPITAVVAGLVLLYAKFQGVRDVVAAVVTFVQTQLANLQRFFEENSEGIREAIEHVTNVIKALWERFGDDIITIIQGRLETVKAVLPAAIADTSGESVRLNGKFQGERMRLTPLGS